MEDKRSQNPDPLDPRGSATRRTGVISQIDKQPAAFHKIVSGRTQIVLKNMIQRTRLTAHLRGIGQL